MRHIAVLALFSTAIACGKPATPVATDTASTAATITAEEGSVAQKAGEAALRARKKAEQLRDAENARTQQKNDTIDNP